MFETHKSFSHFNDINFLFNNLKIIYEILGGMQTLVHYNNVICSKKCVNMSKRGHILFKVVVI